MPGFPFLKECGKLWRENLDNVKSRYPTWPDFYRDCVNSKRVGGAKKKPKPSKKAATKKVPSAKKPKKPSPKTKKPSKKAATSKKPKAKKSSQGVPKRRKEKQYRQAQYKELAHKLLTVDCSKRASKLNKLPTVTELRNALRDHNVSPGTANKEELCKKVKSVEAIMSI